MREVRLCSSSGHSLTISEACDSVLDRVTEGRRGTAEKSAGLCASYSSDSWAYLNPGLFEIADSPAFSVEAGVSNPKSASIGRFSASSPAVLSEFRGFVPVVLSVGFSGSLGRPTRNSDLSVDSATEPELELRNPETSQCGSVAFAPRLVLTRTTQGWRCGVGWPTLPVVAGSCISMNARLCSS